MMKVYISIRMINSMLHGFIFMHLPTDAEQNAQQYFALSVVFVYFFFFFFFFEDFINSYLSENFMDRQP